MGLKTISVSLILIFIVTCSSSFAGGEIYGDYVSEYTEGPGSNFSDLNTAGIVAENFVEYIIDAPRADGYYSEDDADIYGNNSAWSDDFATDDYAEKADVAFFVGHGFGGSFVFTTDHDEYVLPSSEMSLGDGDLEFLFTFTCNFTNPTTAHPNDSDFPGSEPFDPNMMNGLHIVCGYKTNMTITADAGLLLADYLTGFSTYKQRTVREAWRMYGEATQQGAWENTMRIWFADDCKDDYLAGLGDVSSDPEPYSDSPNDYSYVDYDLNWD